MIVGPLLAAAGLFYLVGITPEGSYFSQVLPGLVMLGIGLSMLFVPLQNLALTGVEPHDAGVASATVSATFNIGGSIGLAVITVLYAEAVENSLDAGNSQLVAYTDGYSMTFLVSAIAMVLAAVLAAVLIRGTKDELRARDELT
jgi:hypothetical protein